MEDSSNLANTNLKFIIINSKMNYMVLNIKKYKIKAGKCIFDIDRTYN